MSLVGFEIQALHGREWRIVEVCEERGEALLAAHRLLERDPHWAGVRVVEEVYDPATNQASGATIFRRMRQHRHSGRSFRRTRTPAPHRGRLRLELPGWAWAVFAGGFVTGSAIAASLVH